MRRTQLLSIVFTTFVSVSVLAQSNQPPETETGAFASYEEATSRTKSTAGYSTLQKIGLAFHGYHDIFGRFPPAVLFGPDGKTPYSWRVELLPVLKHYAGQIDPQTDISTRQAYDEAIAACGYDTSLPWDDPENLKVLQTMPDAYRHPSDHVGSTDAGFYAITGSGTSFDPATISKCSDVSGWPSSTLMVAEYRAREPWTKPVDIEYSLNTTVPRFGGFSQHGFLALSADGAVHFVADSVMPNDLRAFISTDQSDVFMIPGIPNQYARSLLDVLIEETILPGDWKNNANASTGKWTLEISERDGDKFKGRLSIHRERDSNNALVEEDLGTHEVEGRIGANYLSFQSVNNEKVQARVTGKLIFNVLMLNYQTTDGTRSTLKAVLK